VQEVLQAYLEAVRKNDEVQIPFWRAVLLERMVMVDDAVKHYQGTSGTNSE
jgi:hypothetical protein